MTLCDTLGLTPATLTIEKHSTFFSGNQLDKWLMTRELCKAWTGFRSVKGHVVATGHWGCGAFGGDPNIKCLLQVMAASMAEVKQLDFYCFNDEACEIIFCH